MKMTCAWAGRTLRLLDDWLEICLVASFRFVRNCVTRPRWFLAVGLVIYTFLPLTVSFERDDGFKPEGGVRALGFAEDRSVENPTGIDALSDRELSNRTQARSTILTFDLVPNGDDGLLVTSSQASGDVSPVQAQAALERLLPVMYRVRGRVHDAHDQLEAGGLSPVRLNLGGGHSAASHLMGVLRILDAAARHEVQRGRPDLAVEWVITSLELLDLFWEGACGDDTFLLMLAQNCVLKRMHDFGLARCGSVPRVEKCLTLLARVAPTTARIETWLRGESTRAAATVGEMLFNGSAVRVPLPMVSHALVLKYSTAERGSVTEALRDRVHSGVVRLLPCLQGDASTVKREVERAGAELLKEHSVPGGLGLAWVCAKALVSTAARGDLLARQILTVHSFPLARELGVWAQLRYNASNLTHELAIERYKSSTGRVPDSVDELRQSLPEECRTLIDTSAVKYVVTPEGYRLDRLLPER